MLLDRPCMLTVLVAVLAATRAVALQEPDPTTADRFEAALSEPGEPGEPGDDGAELEARALELARLPEATEALLTAWTEGGLGSAQARLLDLTARSIDGREVVYAVSSALSGRADSKWRRAALRLLELHATSGELRLLGELAAGARGQDEETVDAFSLALTGVLRRDARAFDELHVLMAASLFVRSGVVRAVGGAGDRTGLPWLARQLKEPDLASVALQEIGRLARVSSGNEQELRKRVRTFLRSRDSGLQRQAMRAAVALRDTAAIPDLIEITMRADGGGQRMAFSALRKLTGQRLPDRAGAWETWYEREQSWMQDEAPAALERLASGEDAEVVAAVHALSCRGLARDHFAVELAHLLRDHPSATVRGQVCLGLQRLGSTAALSELVHALDDEDPAVRAHAYKVLSSLTGRSLPPDPEAWMDELVGAS